MRSPRSRFSNLPHARAAEHWLQAERDRPGETRPDEILRLLRAAIERAEGQRKPREPRQPRRPGQPRRSRQGPRESSKEAMVIELLRRPEGATIAQIIAATGWQAHTCRGAFAGALKKKRGLTVSEQLLLRAELRLGRGQVGRHSGRRGHRRVFGRLGDV